MSKIVLSEGQNDIYFLNELHNRYVGDLRYDTFNNKVAEMKESARVRMHKVGGKFDILYKAEGGRPNISMIFVDMIIDLIDSDLEVYVVIDLDNDALSELYGEISKYFQSDYGNRVSFIQKNRISTDDLYILTYNVSIPGNANKDVKFFAFYSDLEETTGLQKKDCTSTKRRKLRQYIENSPEVYDKFAEELYDISINS